MTESTLTADAIGAVVDLATRSVAPSLRLFDVQGGVKAVILRNDEGGEQVEIIDNVGGLSTVKPGRIYAHVTVETQQSLIDYAVKFKAANSALFASIKGSTILAVLDFHAAGGNAAEPIFSPDFCDHCATLKLPFSTEFDIWKEFDGKLMDHGDFVRFIDENREDIVSPDAATVFETVKDLQSVRKADFRSVARVDTDHLNIEFAESVEAKSNRDGIELPTEFVLGLPIYFEGAEEEIHALLRWKVVEGKLALGFVLKRVERIRQARFKLIVQEIAEASGISAVYGAFSAHH